ncbi:BA75_03624T0 [Komagataella pastoris]|uniref:BA75_03624T0 n=1 Tax=Komagataella pastoris TaxID=4922 RepID=A0A1B2JF63_PICPA|nr:BA75_03624T0 [Komagataella pastoris]
MERSLSWHKAIVKSLMDDWATKSTEDSYLRAFYANYNFLDDYSTLDLDFSYGKSSSGEDDRSHAPHNTRPDNAGTDRPGEISRVTNDDNYIDNDDSKSVVSQALSSNDSLVNVNLYRFHYTTLNEKRTRSKPAPKTKTRRNNKRTSYANVVFRLS